jgi:disulfide bond formation protein DsbB
MMAYALYSQHQLLLDPCPLCIFQRIAVMALGIVFVIAVIHDPGDKFRRLYALLLGAVAAMGVAVAAWHVRLQHLPADEVPSCGPGLSYMLDNFPLQDTLALVFRGSGDCADVSWRFLGLAMPTWVVISLTLLGIVGVWNNLRRT